MGKEQFPHDRESASRTVFRHVGLTPRLAPPGVRLARPADVSVGPTTYGADFGSKRGSFDPFNYTQNGLLLVEEFARLDIGHEPGGTVLKSRLARRALERWLLEFGVPGGDEYGHIREFVSAQFGVREYLRVFEALSTLDAIRHPDRWRPSQGFAVTEGRFLVSSPDSPDYKRRRRLDAHSTLRLAIEGLLGGLNELGTWPEIAATYSEVRLPLAEARLVRRWTDLLVPIDFQLLEAALRLGEGRRIVRRCRTCGEVFLSLHEGRALYCNTRHQNRFAQREHRARVAVRAPE